MFLGVGFWVAPFSSAPYLFIEANRQAYTHPHKSALNEPERA